MSVLNFGYVDPAAVSDRLPLVTDFTKLNPWNITLGTSGHGLTEDFNFKRLENSSSSRIEFSNSNRREVMEYILAACDLVNKPTNTEYWVRFGLRSVTTSINTTTGSDFDQIVFYNYNGTRYKMVAKLVLNAATWKFYVYTATEGSNTVTYTYNFDAPTFGVDANGNMYIDVRVKLDAAAGFVQIYGTSGTLLSERIGITSEGLQVTHIAATQTLYNTITSQSTFTIIADESTMGMFVAPIYAKAEGGLQQQDSGGAYTAFQYRLVNPGSLGTVSLTAATGVTKQYSMKAKSMTDIALPANYIIKSVKLCGILEAQSAKYDGIPVKLLLRDSTTTTVSEAVAGNVIPNITGSSNKLYQRFNRKMDTNPLTGSSWTVNDFNTLEFGFSFTGN